MGKLTLFFIFILLPLAAAVAAGGTASGLRRDTASPVMVRAFSFQALEGYHRDRSFRYEQAPVPGHGLWPRIRYWLATVLESLVSFATGTVTGKLLMWLVLALACIYITLRMAGFRGGSPLIGGGSPDLAFVREDDIGSVDFDAAIAAAVRDANYRVAVRLWYLKTLQSLSTGALIDWRPGKTNYQYLRELNASPLAARFALLTREFEYCWYGDEPVDSDAYRMLEERFAGFNRQIASV